MYDGLSQKYKTRKLISPILIHSTNIDEFKQELNDRLWQIGAKYILDLQYSCVVDNGIITYTALIIYRHL